MEQEKPSLPVGTLLDGLEAIVESLESTLRTNSSWTMNLEAIREKVGELKGQLREADRLNEPCLLRRTPPYGGPVSC